MRPLSYAVKEKGVISMLSLNDIKKGVLRQTDVRGLIIFEDGMETCRHPEKSRRNLVHSVAKSVTAIGVGFALEEGILQLEERLTDAFREEMGAVFNNLAAKYDAAYAEAHLGKLEHIQLKHLLSNTAGFAENFLTGFQRPYLTKDDWVTQCLSIPVTDRPGSRFLYCDANFYLIAKLIQRRCHQSLSAYLMPRLFCPLGIHHPTWELDPDGDAIGCGGLLLNLDELHVLGRLCLDNGCFDGNRVVPPGWMETVTTARIAVQEGRSYMIGSGNGTEKDCGLGYGYGFWTAPDFYYMFGFSGIYNFISRSGDLLITVDGLKETEV